MQLLGDYAPKCLAQNLFLNYGTKLALDVEQNIKRSRRKMASLLFIRSLFPVTCLHKRDVDFGLGDMGQIILSTTYNISFHLKHSSDPGGRGELRG